MENRWFHRVRLHSPKHGHERKVGWLELFYDLVYVATLIQLGDALSHHVDVKGALTFAALFLPIWFTWTGYTFFSNRFVVDDFSHRALTFLQMAFIGGMAVTVGEVFEGDTKSFFLCYAGARAVLAILYARAWRQVPETGPFVGRFAIGFAVGTVLWAASAFVPLPWAFALWILAMGIDLSVPLSRRARELTSRFPPDVLHMSERYGLLTIIVLGESFVKVLSYVADKGVTPDRVTMAVLALAVTVSLWWIYFDDVAGSRIKRLRLAPFIWIYSHLPMTLAVTAVGVAIKKAAAMDPHVPGGDPYRWLLCGMLGLTLLSVGVIDAVTERRQSELSDRARVRVRLFSGAVILLLAPAGAYMDAWVFVAMVSSVCLLQVFLDLAMSPLAADPEAAHEEDPAMVETATQRQARLEAEAAKPKRPSLEDAVRKGAPSELRRDLYFHLMQASWTQVFVWVVVAYLAANVVFASLYLLDPAGVTGLGPAQSFLHAFSFSVQTISTIGYGAMSPLSDYAHGLVAAEALVGLLGVALVTGMVFAKASRPQSSVLFSNKVIIARYHGVPTLMLRVGNARGNDVVEASMRLSVLMNEVSPEGDRMRRLYDVKLVREVQPLFALSWMIFHTIDEDSPFYGVEEHGLPENFSGMVAILTGHDGTYGQTIHARNFYFAEDVAVGRRYVDIASTLPDGRVQIDYTVFHDTIDAPL
jgi:low temperature requirement protein LtrA